MANKLIDTFKQTADMIAVLNRGHGIPTPDLQSTLEYLKGRVDATTPTLEIISVKDFGAKGDGVTDDSQAFQNAINAPRQHPAKVPSAIFIPPGRYMIHEVEWNGATSLIGASLSSVQIQYNGSDAENGYIFKRPPASGSIPYAGFFNIRFLDAEDGLSPAYAIDIQTGVDWGFMLENIAFQGKFQKAAVRVAGVVNFFARRLRFDAITGYCFEINQGTGAENRPIHIQDFTWDNYHGTGNSGGLGFMLFNNAHGLHVNIENGRIELNSPLNADTGYKSLIRIKNKPGAGISVSFKNVVGYCLPTDGAYAVLEDEKRSNVTFNNCTMDNYAALYHALNQTKPVLVNSPKLSLTSVNGNSQRDMGIVLEGKRFEVRTAKPGASTFTRYQKGDMVFLKDSLVDGRWLGYIVTSPDGVSVPTGHRITDSAIVVSGNTTVSNVPINLPEKSYIKIVGAGPNGDDLLTHIVSIDRTNKTWTIADAPSTSVNPATVNWQTPTFEKFGLVGGISGLTANPNIFFGNDDGNNWEEHGAWGTSKKTYQLRYIGDGANQRWVTLSKYDGDGAGLDTIRLAPGGVTVLDLLKTAARFSQPVRPPVYTIATLPSASAYANHFVMISDPAASKGRLVYSDGEAWRYVSDDSIV